MFHGRFRGKHNNHPDVANEESSLDDISNVWGQQSYTDEQPVIIIKTITLSGREESGLDDISSVLGQQSYTDEQPVIKSSLANIPSRTLGANGLLEELNGTLGTSYTLEILPETLWYALTSCIERHEDIGTSYALLCPYWFKDTSRNIVKDERKDQDMRKQLLVDNKIIDGDAPPRRVWDLYANRVVPYWVVGKYPWAISHAWVNDEELTYVRTPINQYEWPVPIPKGTSLDLIRIEMLNLGAEYVWLDVLCLRQKLSPKELGNLRLQEWNVDIPTIGWVYQEADAVVCYFSGLGRPLRLTSDYFATDHCWFNRAWSLQEMNIDLIIGGRTGPEVPAELHARLDSSRQMRRDDFVFDILSKMKTRKSTRPVDRVAALVYLFHSEYFPIYDEYQFEEDAWTALLNITQDWFRADLFFFYPEPGDGKKFWRPSWNQVMNHTVSWRDPSQVMGKIQWVGEGKDVDWYRGPYIESGDVRGLGDATNASAQKMSRRGELRLKDPNGATRTFKIIADHTYPIPDGPYTLIGSTGFPSTRSALLWVVGKMEVGKFKKFSVFSMADDRVGARLQGLEIAEDREVVLW